MTMQPVESEAISEIGYDADTRTLRVKFKKTGVYDFLDVSPDKHQALLAAESKGRHFQTHIRLHHEFQKV